MDFLVSILSIVVLVGIVAGLWQHARYLGLRRNRVEDRQSLLYPARTFHAVTFLRTEAGGSVIADVAALCLAVERNGKGILVYAGQVGMSMVKSDQVPNDWDAIVLVQYPSREAFDRFRDSKDYEEAMAPFADSYTHGVIRGAKLNLALPLGLLVLRITDILRRRPSMLPYVPVGDDVMPQLKLKIKEVEQLDAFRDLKDDAVVIFNLIKPGNDAQRKADRSYARQMMSGMAEGGYGPMHMGKAVTVEGSATFKTFAVVYYPGIDHMQAMLGSTFMNRIGGGKQLGDSIAVATIPIGSRLQASQQEKR
jgi:uncharacterized protein (DUF1330 family)